jgi:twitching motility protein PilT
MTRSSTRNDLPPSGTSNTALDVGHLLRLAASLGASTLYLSSNTRPSVRVDGAVQPLEGTPVLDPAEIETMLIALVLTHHGASRGALAVNEWSFDLPDVGRVRCLTFRDGRGPGAVFRIVPSESAVDDQADLSLDIQALAIEREGLVVVAGPRASGKQAVIGALVDLVNRSRRGYVITVQREVTSLTEGEGSFISQREARGGLDDILTVARAALQENPDVLVLQEVRSAPLMSLAFDAAASGQLVIAGLTAPSATGAIQRIIDLYPPEQARHAQLSLAQHLRGVIGQVLLPKISGGRVAARELLLNTPAVSSVLAAGKAVHLAVAMAAGRKQGMVPLSDVLVDLVRSGVVAAADAYRQAADPVGFLDDLKRLGIDTSFVHRL